jgi:hypothetical protein
MSLLATTLISPDDGETRAPEGESLPTDQDDFRLPGQWRQGADDPANFLTAQRRQGRLHPDLRPNVEKR